LEIRVVRSSKRRKTVQAQEVDGILRVCAPAAMSDEELEPYILSLKERIERQKVKPKVNDDALEERARVLNQRYFDGRLRWVSVSFTTNQSKRYGSCATDRGIIRISHRIAHMPRFVQDYVLVHELAHLAEPNHGRRFWDLVYRYPRAERARGYLMGAGLEECEE
jgi:hypothetical protein